MHGDGCSGLAKVTNEEFAQLQPFEDDMLNCNPLPQKFHNLLFNEIYGRRDDKVTEDNVDWTHASKNILVQTLC